MSFSYEYLISSDDGYFISSRCLTTETEKIYNENSFIENLAASKYSMWAQRVKRMQHGLAGAPAPPRKTKAPHSTPIKMK